MKKFGKMIDMADNFPDTMVCPKCKGTMDKGAVSTPMAWGKFSAWNLLLINHIKTLTNPTRTYKCQKCGYLEFYEK